MLLQSSKGKGGDLIFDLWRSHSNHTVLDKMLIELSLSCMMSLVGFQRTQFQQITNEVSQGSDKQKKITTTTQTVN